MVKMKSALTYLKNATFTYEAQFDYSQNATVEFSPMEYFPVESVNPTRTATAVDYTTTPTGTVAPQITVAASKSPPLSAGAIAGVAIGGFAVLVLAAALLYMCGRQKTVKEILRQSTIVPTNHNSYQPTALGISEAQYPNMMKNNSPNTPGRDNESYRSTSPPIDERTGMMVGGMHPMHFQHSQTSPGLSSPGFSNPGSPGFPSPMYSERHEMENSTAPAGLMYVFPFLSLLESTTEVLLANFNLQTCPPRTTRQRTPRTGRPVPKSKYRE
jgi:hypothetical protein